MDEWDRLFQNSLRGIKDFLASGGEDHKVTDEELEHALKMELAQKLPEAGPSSVTKATQAILDKLAKDSNPNTVQVIKKIFKSARLAAITLGGGEAQYQDVPLMSDEDRAKLLK